MEAPGQEPGPRSPRSRAPAVQPRAAPDRGGGGLRADRAGRVILTVQGSGSRLGTLRRVEWGPERPLRLGCLGRGPAALELGGAPVAAHPRLDERCGGLDARDAARARPPAL